MTQRRPGLVGSARCGQVVGEISSFLPALRCCPWSAARGPGGGGVEVGKEGADEMGDRWTVTGVGVCYNVDGS